MGKTENFGTADDPWPVQVPGREKPVLSTKIGEYVDEVFLYYFNFYQNCKHSGPPFSCGWIDWPYWVTQLMREFDVILDSEKRQRDFKFLAQIHGYRVGK